MQRDTQFDFQARAAPATRGIAVNPIPNLPPQRLDEAALRSALAFAESQVARTATELNPSTGYPQSAPPGGAWATVPVTDLVGWTQGFLPGLLWYLYQHTKSDIWRQRADAWTRPLEAQQYNMRTHDLGFKFAPSHAEAFAQTGDAYYRRVALAAAGSLASRYNPRVDIISCSDWLEAERGWQLPLVVDTMVDLELLFWAATQNQVSEPIQGQEGWRDMALNHALTTLRDLVRTSPDGSTYHVINYDPLSGNIRDRDTLQGAGPETTWSRGQAWALYGYTMAYRYTRDARMLEAAQRVTDFYLSRVSGDLVPNWDFDSGTQHKDSSAAAIAASAMMELTTFVSDGVRRENYWSKALATLTALMSPPYLAQGTNNNRSILLQGVGNLRANKEVDVGLIYGDYYFLESLLRYRRLVPEPPPPPGLVWESKLNFSQCVFSLGAGNTGTRTVEFDVTPNAAPIDGVVGYADSSTNVTAYNSLAMAIRMNPTGVFDVRNGANYGFVTRVAYSAGTAYHVRMVTNLVTKRYSVWVRPSGGSEVQLANNYVFRSDAPATDDLGKVAVKSGHSDGEFTVRNHTVL